MLKNKNSFNCPPSIPFSHNKNWGAGEDLLVRIFSDCVPGANAG